MASLIMRMRTLAHDDGGQDLIEYALLAGLISLVVVAAVTAAGEDVGAFFTTKVTDRLGQASK